MFGLGSLLTSVTLADMLAPSAFFLPSSFRGRTKRSSLNRRKSNSLAHHGLNGPRAVAHRLRQIEAGRLRVQKRAGAVVKEHPGHFWICIWLLLIFVAMPTFTQIGRIEKSLERIAVALESRK